MPQATAVQPLAAGKYIDVDGATATRLKRGDYPVHARLDLHGMNRAEAYGALRSAVENAYLHGKRCVLVITGKGRAEGSGILKSHLPHWLNDAALRPLVLALGEAAPKHGGSGAYYVLIKRKREGAAHG
jgi:DNA-nicking Smr family endonuclease